MTELAWTKQKKLQEKQIIPTQNELFRVASSFEIPQEKTLFLLLYLTAGRVSEVIGLTKDNFQKQYRDGKEFVVIRMENRKHKTRHYKLIPIPMEKEGFLMQPVLDYLDAHNKQRLFRFKTPCRGWQIIGKANMNPHWLRHIRLTHLITIYDMKETQMQMFAGWTNTKPASVYSELNWGDLAKKMI